MQYVGNLARSLLFLQTLGCMSTSGRGSLSHYVLQTPIGDVPEGKEEALFGLGCFWGAERKFWQQSGVITTAVGYCGGDFPSPTYEKICTGTTRHAEVVKIVFDPEKITYKDLLHVFWSNHDPTQQDRQGNDIGSQYRSVIFYYTEEQQKLAEATKNAFQRKLQRKGYDQIVTEILDASMYPFYFAEDYHQQYLAKNPAGYCGLKGTGCYEPAEINSLLKF